MAYHLQAWGKNKWLLLFRSFDVSHKIFLSGSRNFLTPLELFWIKRKLVKFFRYIFFVRLATIQTIFWLLLFLCTILRNTMIGYMIRWPSMSAMDLSKKKRKRETTLNHHSAIYFKFLKEVQLILSVQYALWLAVKTLNIHCYLPLGNARGTYAQNYCSYFMDKCVQTIFLRHIILLSLYILKQLFTSVASYRYFLSCSRTW